MVIWQGVTTLSYAISRENEDVGLYCGMGIWLLIIRYMIIMPIDCVIELYNKTHYVAMMLDTDNKPCYCRSREEPDILQNIGYKWNNPLADKYKIADGWKKQQCVFGKVNLRYTPIRIAKAEGAYRVDKKTIAEAR
jgi:hypothetical protein